VYAADTGAKQGLPPGPWWDEPDHLEWWDSDTGLPCLIQRVPGLGHLCGYAGVLPWHPWYGLDHDDAKVRADSYGGLTWSDYYEEIGGKTWWFGFDCAHTWDLVPGMPPFPPELEQARTYRTLGFVEFHVVRLAWQLGQVEVGEQA